MNQKYHRGKIEISSCMNQKYHRGKIEISSWKNIIVYELDIAESAMRMHKTKTILMLDRVSGRHGQLMLISLIHIINIYMSYMIIMILIYLHFYRFFSIFGFFPFFRLHPFLSICLQFCLITSTFVRLCSLLSLVTLLP